jgi:hypothetical protein
MDEASPVDRQAFREKRRCSIFVAAPVLGVVLVLAVVVMVGYRATPIFLGALLLILIPLVLRTARFGLVARPAWSSTPQSSRWYRVAAASPCPGPRCAASG